MSQAQYTHTQNISGKDIFAKPINLEEKGELSVVLAGDETTVADLVRGTVMGQVTATLKYVPYNDGAVDGSEVAVGILSKTFAVNEQFIVDSLGVKTKAENPATLYTKGTYVESECTGIDAAAKVDLIGCTFV